METFSYDVNDTVADQTENASVNASASITEDLFNYTHGDYFPPLNEFIPNVLVYGLTLILGITGNGLVIFSIACYQRLRNVTNIFLISLACADLLLVLFCVPVQFAHFLSFTWTFGEFLCKFVHYMQNFTMICSVLTLTAMSLERYYAILHPIKARSVCTRRHAFTVCICVWITSMVLAFPILIGRIHELVGVPPVTGYWCSKQFPADHWLVMYEVYMCVVIFIIPVTVMVFAYTSICSELWVVTYRRATMRSGHEGGFDNQNETQVLCEEGNKGIRLSHLNGMKKNGQRKMRPSAAQAEDDCTRKQVIKMLVCVILLYVICWSPVLVLNLIAAFVEDWRKNYTPSLKYTREAFFLLSYLNSCVNPIVYGFMSKNFRQSFKQTICACCEKRKYSRRYTIERQTTTYMSTTMSRMDSTMTSPKAEESGSPSKDNHVTSGPVSV